MRYSDATSLRQAYSDEGVIERLDAEHDVEVLRGPGRETRLVEHQVRRCASDEEIVRLEAVEVLAKAVEAGGHPSTAVSDSRARSMRAFPHAHAHPCTEAT